MAQNSVTETSYFFSMFIVTAKVSRGHASCSNLPGHPHQEPITATTPPGTWLRQPPRLSSLFIDPLCIIWSCLWDQALCPCHHQLSDLEDVVCTWLEPVESRVEARAKLRHKIGDLDVMCNIFQKLLTLFLFTSQGWPLMFYRPIQRLGHRVSDSSALSLLPWIFYTLFSKNLNLGDLLASLEKTTPILQEGIFFLGSYLGPLCFSMSL